MSGSFVAEFPEGLLCLHHVSRHVRQCGRVVYTHSTTTSLSFPFSEKAKWTVELDDYAGQ